MKLVRFLNLGIAGTGTDADSLNVAAGEAPGHGEDALVLDELKAVTSEVPVMVGQKESC